MQWEPRGYVSTSREDLTSPAHRFYFVYWRRKRGTQRRHSTYGRRTLRISTKVALLHVLPDMRDFRCQLLSGRIAKYLSSAATGLTLQEIMEPWRFPDRFIHGVTQFFQRVCELKSLMRLKFPARTWRGHDFSAFEALCFPLADDAGVVSKLLVVVSCDEDRTGQHSAPFGLLL